MPNGRTWVVTEGHTGMENQALGLAEAIGLETEIKRVRLRFPWTYVPPSLLVPPLGAVAPGTDQLAPPWPDLMITCGRRSTGLSMAVRRASQGATFTVHIQDPLVNPRHFDLVVIPAHDKLRGLGRHANVLVTRAALHRVTPARLAAAAKNFGATFAELPRPLVAVLVGGSNRYFRLTAQIMRQVAAQLADLARNHGAGLLVTTSRRTGAANEEILRDALTGLSAQIWSGDGDNPYFAYLAAADAIIVTGDSVSMTSEACSTGKPVHVIGLDGGSRRFRAFHNSLRAAGMTRPFTGALETWAYDPPDDTEKVAAEVCAHLLPDNPAEPVAAEERQQRAS